MNRLVKIPLYVCCTLGLFCMNVYATSGDICLHLWNSGEYQKAVSTCENACSKNDSRGCLGLGNLYLMGNGVKQDYIKAKTYFEKACNLDNSDGCYHLGFLYEVGLGVDWKEYDKAKIYYEKACNLNDDRGCYEIGSLYRKERRSEAYTYFHKACNLNNGQGCYAVNNYKKACDLYNGSGCRSLGNSYLYGYNGVEQNHNKAKEFYEKGLAYDEKACNQNDSSSCAALGSLYKYGGENGMGIEKNLSKALKYYEKACNLNNASSCSSLGFLLEDKIMNKKQAEAYYKKGCSLNDGFSCFFLGEYYSKDQDQSRIALYEKSCYLNDGDACKELGEIYELGKYGVEENEKQSEIYYEKACRLDGSLCSTKKDRFLDRYIYPWLPYLFLSPLIILGVYAFISGIIDGSLYDRICSEESSNKEESWGDHGEDDSI